MKKIIILLLVVTGFASANFLTDWWGDTEKVNITKTAQGFVFTPKKVKTQYKSKIVWGPGLIDHIEGNPARGIAVVVYGTDWEYSTVTDDLGGFIVPVGKGPFTIKASDGNQWCVYEGTLPEVPKGTIGE